MPSDDGIPPPSFTSPEALDAHLRQVAARLHHINRVAMGESRFVWWYAELLKAAGRMAPLMKDPEVADRFGDGWTPGTSSDPRAELLALLEETLPKR